MRARELQLRKLDSVLLVSTEVNWTECDSDSNLFGVHATVIHDDPTIISLKMVSETCNSVKRPNYVLGRSHVVLPDSFEFSLWRVGSDSILHLSCLSHAIR